MFPYKRILHFWAKGGRFCICLASGHWLIPLPASLFANPTMKYILTSAGNIAVDRKAKDRRKLFRGTLEALACGGVVAVFPEGTSYTEPRIVQVKDGAAWATLEYAKWAKGHPDQVKPGAGRVAVVTASIVYTNKTKYRSNVNHFLTASGIEFKPDLIIIIHRQSWSKILLSVSFYSKCVLKLFVCEYRFGPSISIDPYLDQFMSPEEGASRAAVKGLTAAIERQLIEGTINAPDWYASFFLQ